MQNATYSATARRKGKKWFHEVLDAEGKVIDTRTTAGETPFVAVIISGPTLNSVVRYYESDLKGCIRRRNQSYIPTARKQLAEAQERRDASEDPAALIGEITFEYSRAFGRTPHRGDLVAEVRVEIIG